MAKASFLSPKMVSHKQAQIGQVVSDNVSFLRSLAHTKSSRKRKQLLKHANSDQLLALVEICLNILCSRFKLTTRQKKRLLPYADFVRRLSRKRTEQGARKILIQKGSGIGGLFAALLTPIVLDIARSVVYK